MSLPERKPSNPPEKIASTNPGEIVLVYRPHKAHRTVQIIEKREGKQKNHPSFIVRDMENKSYYSLGGGTIVSFVNSAELLQEKTTLRKSTL